MLNPLDANLQAKLAGIYKIHNLIDDKIYVGSTKNFNNRKYTHFRQLRLNKHHSRYLQNAWNKYGENNFKFEVLEYVEIIKLVEREQHYLNVLKPEYNICKIAQSVLGVKRSEETKAKMSAWQKGKPISEIHAHRLRSYNNNRVVNENTKIKMSLSQKGRKHSEETKLKQSLAHKGKKKSKEHSKNMGIAKKRLDLWPHELGNRCKCIECKERWRIYNQRRYRDRKNARH